MNIPKIWLLVLCSSLIGSSGCQSLGLTLWPSQLPLLPKAKKFASNSPLPNNLANELSKSPVRDYFVEPGDRLLIEPTKLDSEFQLVGEQQVMVDGSIDLGKFGRLRVAGQTPELIEAAIADRMQEAGEERESINVQLVETNAAQFYVLGAVGSPGAYDMDGYETVLDAILAAGGLTSSASPCSMILVRPTNHCECRVVLPICYRQITQLGDVASNYHLQPGDRIVVGERGLCEELAFWKQSTSCPRCDQSRCVECQPETNQYTSRFIDLFHPFPIPISFGSKSQDEVGAGADSVDAGLPLPSGDGKKAGSNELTPPDADDSDIFLKPVSLEMPQALEAREASSAPNA